MSDGGNRNGRLCWVPRRGSLKMRNMIHRDSPKKDKNILALLTLRNSAPSVPPKNRSPLMKPPFF